MTPSTCDFTPTVRSACTEPIERWRNGSVWRTARPTWTGTAGPPAAVAGPRPHPAASRATASSAAMPGRPAAGSASRLNLGRVCMGGGGAPPSRGGAAGEEIAFDRQQVVDERLPAGGRQSVEVLRAEALGQAVELLERAAGARAEIEAVGTAVPGVIAPLDPSRGHESLDVAADRRGLEAERLGELALEAALPLPDLAQDLALRARQPDARLAQAAIEFAAQEVAQLGEQEAEAPFRGKGGSHEKWGC